jgi:hypothetical protein
MPSFGTSCATSCATRNRRASSLHQPLATRANLPTSETKQALPISLRSETSPPQRHARTSGIASSRNLSAQPRLVESRPRTMDKCYSARRGLSPGRSCFSASGDYRGFAIHSPVLIFGLFSFILSNRAPRQTRILRPPLNVPTDFLYRTVRTENN